MLDIRNVQNLPANVDSNSILAGLNNVYGANKYTQQTMSRWTYYSYVSYPLLGANTISFYGLNQSQATNEFGNNDGANTFANNSMLIYSISYDVKLWLPTTSANPPWTYALDADNPYADIVHGLTQAGIGRFSVNSTIWDEVDLPFMFAPAAIGKNRISLSMSGMAGSQSGTTPFGFTGAQNVLCYADIERRWQRARILKNPIFLPPQTTFQSFVTYPFGLVPIIGTTAITNAATPPTGPALTIGCLINGIRYAPVS